jgi:hypothetical protein
MAPVKAPFSRPNSSPYWGCYTFAEAEYSNQYELSAGITRRF